MLRPASYRHGLIALILAHAGLTFAIAAWRHAHFLTFALDLGQFVQVLHTFLHGGVPLLTTHPPFGVQHFLGFHFSPIVLVLAPLYALIPSPLTLLAVQSLLIASAAWPVARACLTLGLTPRQMAPWLGIFLLSPYVLNAASADFHEIAFAVPLYAWGMVALLERRARWLAVVLVLLLLTKDPYGLAVTGFALAWAWRYRSWKQPVLWAVVGVGLLLLVMRVLMPWLREGYDPSFDFFASRYGWIRDVDAWPGMAVTALGYLLLLLGSFGFLPLAEWALLLPTLPDLVTGALSRNPMPRSPLSYHAAPMFAVLAVAAAAGWKRRAEANCRWRVVPLAMGLTITGIFAVAFAPWPLHVRPGYPHDPQGLVRALRTIPADAPLSVQDNILPHVSARPRVTPFPEMGTARHVLLHFDRPYEDPAYTRFGNPMFLQTPAPYREHLEALLTHGWRVAYWNDPWLVLEKAPGGIEPEVRAEIRDRVWRMLNAASPPP